MSMQESLWNRRLGRIAFVVALSGTLLASIAAGQGIHPAATEGKACF